MSELVQSTALFAVGISIGTALLRTRDFIRSGLVITLVAAVLLVVFSLTYWPWMGYMTKAP